jgi:hypothetical protein
MHNLKASPNALRIVVLGYLVKGPLAGFAWHHLQYVLGLARLGHDVYFVEDSGDFPQCYDPQRNTLDSDPTYGLGFAARAFEQVAMSTRWTYYDSHTKQWHGPIADSVMKICASADILVNLGNTNPLRPWLMNIPVRVLVDTDPGFTQIRILTEPDRRRRASEHTAFFTFAENIGLERCTIPRDGMPWKPTRQPLVLDVWPVTPGPAKGKFTTVMQWDSYPTREHNGHRYGMKSDSFGPYVDLPEKVGSVFELALGGKGAPRQFLRSKGWMLCDPIEKSTDLRIYQHFIQQSKAEFTVAKQGYVASWSGWFSERSLNYLASSRPVLTENTGFHEWLPVGDGVVAFSSPEEAVAGIDEIDCRYEHHCRSAREVAAEFFDARKVLTRLIEKAFATDSKESFSLS